MKGSLQRVRDIMGLHKPDRIPVFDLLHNDAVLSRFNNDVPVAVNDEKTAIRAIVNATDSIRIARFAPGEEKKEALPDGRIVEHKRWTSWRPHRRFSSSAEYNEIKKVELLKKINRIGDTIYTEKEASYVNSLRVLSLFGDDYYYIPSAPSTSLLSIYDEIGIEAFSYFLFDCEDTIIQQLEANTSYACCWINGLPEQDPFNAFFIGDDIAFKTSPIVMPEWLRKHYFPRLTRVIRAIHGKGKKVLFHSDGDLNEIMDDLVEAGIDALNPLEVAAGMNISDLHLCYPELVFVGGIDASNLLPFGKPNEIKDAVIKAIEDSEGQILIGSSTEIHNEVPLENFLAMREAAINYKL